MHCSLLFTLITNMPVPYESNDLASESFIVYDAFIWISKTEDDFSLDSVSGQ